MMEWIFAGSSEALRRLIERCEAAAQSGLPVLVEGEPGTLHEAVVHRVHHLSADAAIPLRDGRAGDLGAALRHAKGFIYIAEIADLEQDTQRHLAEALRARLSGAAGPSVIAATSRDLVEETRRGRFLQDLFLCLSVMPVRIPPLRERAPEDLPALAAALLPRIMGDGIPPALGENAMALMQSYAWPGNYEELRQCLSRSLAQARHGVIEAVHLPAEVRACARAAESAHRPARSNIAASVARLPRLPSIPAVDHAGRVRPLDEVEADLIRIAMAHYKGQMSEVARQLGIGRSTLYRKVRMLGLRIEAF